MCVVWNFVCVVVDVGNVVVDDVGKFGVRIGDGGGVICVDVVFDYDVFERARDGDERVGVFVVC